MGIFDDKDLTINCPTCGKPIKEKVRWFKQDGHVCPNGCGTVLKTEEFRRGIEEADRELEKFKREFGNINIKL